MGCCPGGDKSYSRPQQLPTSIPNQTAGTSELLIKEAQENMRRNQEVQRKMILEASARQKTYVHR